MPDRRPPRLLFSSYHCLLDGVSGAAVSMRDLFRALAQRGWDCRVFCGPQFDYEAPCSVADELTRIHAPFQTRNGTAHGIDLVLHNTVLDGVPATYYETPGASAALHLSETQGRVHTNLFAKVLEETKPDILLTYGGHRMSFQCMALARQRGIKVVFWLRNTLYDQHRFFEHTSGIIVPSRFSEEFYHRTIGLTCTAIPPVLDWHRVKCDDVDRRYLTFINPKPYKGVYVFAAIARELTRLRPDIPMLVVDSHGGTDWLEKAGVDLAHGNVTRMAATHDPREFYGKTRALLAPSLWQETFGRVAAEAMINNIPVLASSRGGLREAVGDGGFLFDIPATYTPDSRIVPDTEDVRWIVEAIIRLWDDEEYYAKACSRADAAARKWQPDHVCEQYERFFRSIS